MPATSTAAPVASSSRCRLVERLKIKVLVGKIAIGRSEVAEMRLCRPDDVAVPGRPIPLTAIVESTALYRRVGGALRIARSPERVGLLCGAGSASSLARRRCRRPEVVDGDDVDAVVESVGGVAGGEHDPGGELLAEGVA